MLPVQALPSHSAQKGESRCLACRQAGVHPVSILKWVAHKFTVPRGLTVLKRQLIVTRALYVFNLRAQNPRRPFQEFAMPRKVTRKVSHLGKCKAPGLRWPRAAEKPPALGLSPFAKSRQ
jgi:hypothetical protein